MPEMQLNKKVANANVTDVKVTEGRSARARKEFAMSTHLTAEALKSKIAEAAKLLVAIPNFVKESEPVSSESPFLVAQKWLIDRLAMLGVYQDEESHDILVNHVTEGDARAAMCENGKPNIPVGRFKVVWSILSGRKSISTGISEPDEEILAKTFKAHRGFAQWSDKELLEVYGLNCQSGVEDELKKRSKGKRCIVFSNEETNEVDISHSLHFLRESRRRDIPIHDQMGDVLRKVYVVGEFPSLTYIECPIHDDTLLFDGYCDQCTINWKDIPYEVLQFVRVVVNEGEGPTNRRERNQLARSCRETNALNKLAEDYPKVRLIYDELAKKDALPSLKRRTASTDDGSQDPFQPGNRRF